MFEEIRWLNIDKHRVTERTRLSSMSSVENQCHASFQASQQTFLGLDWYYIAVGSRQAKGLLTLI